MEAKTAERWKQTRPRVAGSFDCCYPVKKEEESLTQVEAAGLIFIKN